MARNFLKLRPIEIFQNQRGSAILLVLLVAGIGMFIAMTSIQAEADQSFKLFKMGRLIKQDSKFLQVTLNFILNSPPGCASNFLNLQVSPGQGVSISQLTYGDGAGGPGSLMFDLAYPAKSKFGKKKITRMTLEAHPTKFGAPGAGTHLNHFVIEFDDTRKIAIPVWSTTDSAGRILQCHSSTYMDTDSLGNPRTLEEKYCASSSTKKQTSNWASGDCMDCLTRSDSFYLCVACKKKGMTLDSATQTCI